MCTYFDDVTIKQRIIKSISPETGSIESGSFRSYFRSVRSIRPGSFRSDFWGESFRPSWGGSFRPYFIGGSFRPDFWGESFRPDLFIVGKQVRY